MSRGEGSQNLSYLDFSPFSRSSYVIDIYTSKQQRMSFSRKVLASLSPFILKNTRKEAGKLEIKSIANYDAIK
jgi:hypothetical protein